jgi:hypothetical protein
MATRDDDDEWNPKSNIKKSLFIIYFIILYRVEKKRKEGIK